MGLSVIAIMILIILTDLGFRLLSPAPHGPMGELVDVGGFKMHINSTGEKSSKPTLVVEGGSGMATEYYHWLSEGLKDSLRVVRYDRAGIGYSDASGTPRDPETIARELHALLEQAGESPPYIMAGHSLGGPYVRVFTQLYPDEVVAMLLLDSTHPERAERVSLPSESSWKFKAMIRLYELQSVLGDLGILMLYDKLAGPFHGREMEGLPDEINERTTDFLIDGKYIGTIGKEFALYYQVLARAGEADDFGALPLRVFPSAIREIPEEVYQAYLAKGRDLRTNQIKSWEMQEDLVHLSTAGQLIAIDGDHSTIFTVKENADIICREVLEMVRELDW